MEALERNRVFSVSELESLRGNISGLMDTAVTVTGNFESCVAKLEGLAGRIPAEAGNVLSPVLSSYDRKFDCSAYEELKERSQMLLTKITSEIPGKDMEAASVLEEIRTGIVGLKQLTESLKGLLAPGVFNLSYEEFKGMVDDLSAANQPMTDKEKMEIAIQNLGYIPSCAYGNDPVNLITGNFLFEETDLQIQGIPFLKFVRTYNAISRKKGIFGRGWISSFEVSLKEQADGKISILKEDGTEEIFVKRGESYCSNKTENDKLIPAEEGYLYQEADRMIRFDNSGKAVRIETHAKKGITLCYNTEGAVEAVCSDSGRKLQFFYEEGKLVKVADDTGRAVTYEYTRQGLCAVINPMVGKKCYEYGKSNRIEKIINERGLVTIENSYDERKRISCQILPDGGKISYRYPSGEGYTEVTYQDGHKVRFYYDRELKKCLPADEKGQLTYEPTSYYYEDEKELLQKQLRAKYDEKGNLTALRYAGEWKWIEYNDAGLPGRIYSEKGAEFLFAYDACNRVIKKTDGNGNVRRYSYDLCDRLTSVIYPDGSSDAYTYDASGNMVHMREHTGREYDLEYDRANRLCSITENGSRKVELIYNAFGKISKLLTGQGEEIPCETTPMAEKLLSTFAGRASEPKGQTKEYDKAGNVTRRQFLDGREITYIYDCMNRVTKLIRNGKNEYKFSYEKGRCIKKTDPMGGETYYEYDTYGNLHGITDSEGNYFLTAEREVVVKEKEQTSGHTPSFKQERLSAISETGVEELRDESGRLIRRTYSGNLVSEYEYHTGNQIKRIVHSQNGKVLEELCYEYDANDNCISMRRNRSDCPEDSGVYEYEYDKAGRLITVSRNGKIRATYTYDRFGNRLTKKTNEKLDCYSYDKGNRLCEEAKTEASLQEVSVVSKVEAADKREYHVQRGEDSYHVIYRTLPEAVIADDEIKYLLTDHLGSVLRVMRADGSTESIHSYDEFGICEGKEPIYAGYGGYIPAGRDIYATESRYYAPKLGRFLSKDTWKGNIGNPQTWNQWIYVLNNPLRYKDASGYTPAEAMGNTYRQGVPESLGAYGAYSMLKADAGCGSIQTEVRSGYQAFQNQMRGESYHQLLNLLETGTGGLNAYQGMNLTTPSLAGNLMTEGMLSGGMSYSSICKLLGITPLIGDISYLDGIEANGDDMLIQGTYRNGNVEDIMSDIALRLGTGITGGLYQPGDRKKLKEFKSVREERRERAEYLATKQEELTSEEKEEAKELVKAFKKEYPGPGTNMTSEERIEQQYINMLYCKTNWGSALLGSFFSGLTYGGLDNWMDEVGEAYTESMGIEQKVSYTDQLEAVSDEYSFTYGAGTFLGNGAKMLMGGKFLGKFWGLGSKGSALSAIGLDTAVDTAVFTLPESIKAYFQGEDLEEILKDTGTEVIWNFGTNTISFYLTKGVGAVVGAAVERFMRGTGEEIVEEVTGELAEDAVKEASEETTERAFKETTENIIEGGLNSGRVLSNGQSLDDMAKLYAEKVNSNNKWSWMDDFPDAGELSKADKADIRNLAIEKGLIPDVPVKVVTDASGKTYRYADFDAVGLVKEKVNLPEHLWSESDAVQFKWLDDKIGGRPEGYTWHHSEIDGQMELVPTGIHNVYNHNGGRTVNHWAYREGGR